MTVLGKILTFFIFFFSLVFLGFAFTINQLNKDPNGRSWYQVAQDGKKEVEAARRDMTARDNEIAELRGKLAAQTQVTKTAIDQAEAKLAQANDARRQAEGKATQMQTAFVDAQNAARSALEELNRRRAENGELTETLKTREAEIAQLRSDVSGANNRATQAQVEAASYRTRIQKLEKDYSDLARAYEEVVATKARQSGERGDKIAPPDDIQGEVEEVGSDGYVSISIGSDAGLLPGHTLNVLRLTPKPTYLGEMRITDVTAHKAVGRLTSADARKNIKKGDLVANRIVGNRKPGGN